MYPQVDLSQSFERQMEQIKKKFSIDIHNIEKKKGNTKALIREVLRIYAKDWNYEKRGNGQLLPAYYVMRQEFDLAWFLALTLNIRWGGKNWDEIQLARVELEHPEVNPTKPFCVILNSLEAIKKNHYADASPFAVDNQAYNALLFEANLRAIIYPGGIAYDPSPEARYCDNGDDKQYQMTYYSMNEQIKILPLAFRQERYAEVAEMLFRLRYILSTGEPPKIITEGPKHRHYAPWMNMYDLWFQARFAEDETKRKALAWEALFWYFETGLRSAGTTFIRDFLEFTDFCEIIGEFELMGERQEEFLRHFKKWTMHASISFYKKMQANPIQPIPFAERNLPTYDEIRALYEQTYKRPF